MLSVLSRRVPRDLKENIVRYLALGFLIILGMYLIVSLVGAAETIIAGVEQSAAEHHLEDGQFHTFVPLTDAEKKQLTDRGISLEAMFYLDFTEEGRTLRVFQNRQQINLTVLDEGRRTERAGEAVLEKRYCEEQGLEVGDTISISGKKLKIVGIGSVPDYDAPYKNLSDSSVDSASFGLAFVSEETYASLKNLNQSDQSEEYSYAYLLNGKMADQELKEKIQSFYISSESIEDPWFQEYWDETGGKKEELENGIEKLSDGAEELLDGLYELDGYRYDLVNGAGEILDAYLSEATTGLKDYGLKQKLTEYNFEQELNALKADTDSAIVGLKLNSILKQLQALKEYRDGMKEYTEGVTEAADGSQELFDGVSELQDHAEELLDEVFDLKLSNLTEFLTAADNPRIKASSDDQQINKLAGLAAGVIIMILFTYVISVFVVHGIEQESSMIGVLYALGARKNELLIHYLMLPVAVTFLAAVAGTLFGISSLGIPNQMQDCYAYYSFPTLKPILPPYLMFYGLALPPLTAVVVNVIVINRKLSKTALELIRREQKSTRTAGLALGNLGFISRFRIRQMLREFRTGFTVIFSMLISMLILMLAVDCYVMCVHLKEENRADTKYEYMYTCKYPEREVPEGGVAAYARTLKKEIYGYSLDVTLLGTGDDNPYFDTKPPEGKNSVILSTAMAQKFKLEEGDSLILSDAEEDMDYAFHVAGITQYSVGLYVFMDMDSMRELFGERDDYYNVIFSDHDLQIDAGRLYAVTTKEEISKSAEVFISLMMSMIVMMSIVAALIFAVVMYLMMKVMMDRASFGISLLRVFGYRTGEIRRLYLNGNFYLVAVGAAICIPLAKRTMDAIYPLLVSNVGSGMNLTFSWQLYLGIYGGVMLLYALINCLLVRRLKKVVPADVLKNRE